MAIDTATLRLRFPEFNDEDEYPDARIKLFISDSSSLYMGTDENRWNGKYDIAQSYLTAHLLLSGEKTSLGDNNATVGPIINKTVGNVSVTRGATVKDRSELDDFFMSTSYGQTYLNIRNNSFAPALYTCGL